MKKIIILFITLSLFSCSKNEETPAETAFEVSGNQISLTEQQKKNAGIETTILGNQSIANKIMLSGQINVPPQSMSEVSSSTGGIVKMARFMPGNYVSKGQTLAVVENPELAKIQQDYLQARSALSYAQKDYERQKYLNQYQASSNKVMQRALSEKQIQNAAVHGMASQLRSYGINAENVSTQNIQKTISITAPISGYISAVNVSVGQFISPSEILYTLINNNSVQLELKVFEKDLDKISLGQRVYAFTNQNPTKKYAANVILISKDFAPDRSVMVHCNLVDKNESLIPGTFMNAEVEVNAEEGFVIADDAIVTWENKQYIFEEVKPKTYKMFPVNIGNSENGYTELLNFDPKNRNKKFVVKGAYSLLMAIKNVEE